MEMVRSSRVASTGANPGAALEFRQVLIPLVLVVFAGNLVGCVLVWAPDQSVKSLMPRWAAPPFQSSNSGLA
jgi:hypothetical protein